MKRLLLGAKNDTGYICDYCEQDDGRPTIVWRNLPKRKGHFVLCYDCVERLSIQFLPVKHKSKTIIILKRIIISETIRNSVFKRDGYKCIACGSGKRLALDHIIPFSAGGETKKKNLQTLCKSCNSKKGSKVKEVLWKTDGLNSGEKWRTTRCFIIRSGFI